MLAHSGTCWSTPVLVQTLVLGNPHPGLYASTSGPDPLDCELLKVGTLTHLQPHQAGVTQGQQGDSMGGMGGKSLPEECLSGNEYPQRLFTLDTW